MYTWPGMDTPPARPVTPHATVTLKPEWINSAEKWLKPLISARAEEHRRAYGIGGNRSPAESIRQACVWALHLHRTTWENALDYTAAYDALVAEIKARRRRSAADRARTATARPIAPAIAGYRIPARAPLPAAPIAGRPVTNPEDCPLPRQRGPMFALPVEAALPLPPDPAVATPITDRLRETQRGIAPGAVGGSHYQAGRFWTSPAAAQRALAGQAERPRAQIQRGIRRMAARVRSGRADFTVTMGQLASLAAEINGRRI
jgi:hypothetical protein